MPNQPTTDDAQRRRAGRLYQAALASGTLVRPKVCEKCGARPGPGKIGGHHYLGYEDEHALDVQWLCQSCHNPIHPVPLALETYPPEARAARMRELNASRTPEKRAELARHARAHLTPEELSAIGRKGAAGHTPESRAEAGRKGGLSGGRAGGLAAQAKLTPEERTRRGQRGAASLATRRAAMSPQERAAQDRANTLRGWETRRARVEARHRSSEEQSGSSS